MSSLQIQRNWSVQFCDATTVPSSENPAILPSFCVFIIIEICLHKPDSAESGAQLWMVISNDSISVQPHKPLRCMMALLQSPSVLAYASIGSPSQHPSCCSPLHYLYSIANKFISVWHQRHPNSQYTPCPENAYSPHSQPLYASTEYRNRTLPAQNLFAFSCAADRRTKLFLNFLKPQTQQLQRYVILQSGFLSFSNGIAISLLFLQIYDKALQHVSWFHKVADHILI